MNKLFLAFVIFALLSIVLNYEQVVSIGLTTLFIGVQYMFVNYDTNHDTNQNVTGGKEKNLLIKLEDIPEEMKWPDGKWKYDVVSHAKHKGQRKLLITELMFLTMYDELSDYVIYAGYAPCYKLKALYDLFPDKTWILVDPRAIARNVDSNTAFLKYDFGPSSVKLSVDKKDWVKTIKKKEYRGYVIQDLFTIDLCKLFAELKCLFISDIRTVLDGKNIEDIDILYNTAQHYEWLKVLKPKKFMLKARNPYWFHIDNTDEFSYDKFPSGEIPEGKWITDYKAGKFRQLAGDNYIQSYPPIHSTEYRVVGGPEVKLVYQDRKKMENLFYTYNSKYRKDYALMNHYIKQYCKKYKKDFKKIQKLIKTY